MNIPCPRLSPVSKLFITKDFTMKYSTTILSTVALCVSQVAAFPAAALEYAAKAERDASAAASIAEAVAAHKANYRAPIFDPTTQYVSNQGANAFVPPNLNAGDQRGPCPGLNAMANHGYLPHNGVATIQQFIDGTYKGNFYHIQGRFIC